MAITIKFRRDTAYRWLEANSVLAPGEPGYETDTGRFKIGNGEARWADLEYFHSGNDDELFAAIEAHIQSLQSQNIDEALLHASVVAHIQELQNAVLDDDGPSLFLLYENVKV